MRRKRGFTLIELMIVVLIVAVLASLALSAYNKQIRKSRRTEAKQAISNVQLGEEKWRSNNSTYTNVLANAGGFSPTASGYYTLAISLPASGTCTNGVTKSSANSYVITATKAGDQSPDSQCATMVLTNDCGTATKSSTPSGGTCW